MWGCRGKEGPRSIKQRPLIRRALKGEKTEDQDIIESEEHRVAWFSFI